MALRSNRNTVFSQEKDTNRSILVSPVLHVNRFKIFHLNIRSLFNKISYVELLCDIYDYSVLCFSEPWLNEDQASCVRINDYTLLSSYYRELKKGGGSAIFVKNSILNVSKALNFVSKLSIEDIFECSGISINNNACVIAMYRPCNRDVSKIRTFFNQFDILLTKLQKRFSYIYICGDLNINQLYKDNTLEALTDLLNTHKLKSVIKEITRIQQLPQVSHVSQSAIDYIITNSDETIEDRSNFNVGFSDHFAQCITINLTTHGLQNKASSSDRIIRREFSNANINEFLYLLGIYNINYYETIIDANKRFNTFYDHFTWCFDIAFPKKCTTKNRVPPKNKIKFSLELQQKYNKYKNLMAINDCINDDRLKKQLKMERKSLLKEINLEKGNYVANLINKSENKSKALWNLIKPPSSSKHIPNISLTANHFAQYFEHSITPKQCSATTSKKPRGSHYNNTFFFYPSTSSEVYNIIHSLKNKKSTGIDEIPNELLKACSNVISPVLSGIINHCVTQGCFPDKLKTSCVIPIHKKGSIQDASNYRAISLLSAFSKVFEKCLCSRISSFLEKHNILSNRQFGFRSGKSTEMASAQLMQHIHNELDLNKECFVIYFDIRKAFDSINLGLLSNKLKYLGFRYPVDDFLLSFLSARKFIVKFNNTYSNKYMVNIGTPQGSNLGPIIFLLFINDLPKYITSGSTFMYADDTAVVVSAHEYEAALQKLNCVVREFVQWCQNNQLRINSDKTVIMNMKISALKSNHFTLSIENNVIVCSTLATYLGLKVDENLNWNEHIDRTCSKLNKTYYLIAQLKDRLQVPQLISIYYALVFTHLNYNIICWGASSKAHRLFVYQKRVIRLIFSIKSTNSCKETFIKNKIMPLPCVYIYKVLCFVHQNKNNLTKCGDLHSYNTRGKHKISTFKHSHTFYEKSPYYMGCKLYNLLPKDICRYEIKPFKKIIKDILHHNSYYSITEFIHKNLP
ncbi:hypothetical protein PPYR_04145 [Photinus pyralis]|uniref:Reverse transcriptase domain-containing protein n=1 Tax=Photinus pyralis TaxID=7054 RepID=A0A5N4AX94_PHOPY|nr:hypothetical protein PPYR_04145 [Photinus pyralis]